MKYNYNTARKKIYNLVEKACYSPKNKFTSTVWEYHILPVIQHALKLGRKLKADLEVIELAALLHDYASLLSSKLYDNHHIESAIIAERILTRIGISKEKIEHVKKCIISHRGSVGIKRESLEAKILASSDAMAHITEIPDMFYLTYGVHKFKTKEGAKWLKGKLQRSWNKIMPEGKKMITEDYKIAMKIINKALK